MPNFFYNLVHSSDTCDIKHIGDGLFISNWFSAVTERTIRDFDVKCIINLSERQKSASDLELYQNLGIKYYHYPTSDKVENLLATKTAFRRAETTLNEISPSDPDKRCLIHCTAGRSRSCAFVIYYLMRTFEKPYDVVYNLVETARPSIKLGRGVQKLLYDYESARVREVATFGKETKNKNKKNRADTNSDKHNKPCEVLSELLDR